MQQCECEDCVTEAAKQKLVTEKERAAARYTAALQELHAEEERAAAKATAIVQELLPTYKQAAAIAAAAMQELQAEEEQAAAMVTAAKQKLLAEEEQAAAKANAVMQELLAEEELPKLLPKRPRKTGRRPKSSRHAKQFSMPWLMRRLQISLWRSLNRSMHVQQAASLCWKPMQGVQSLMVMQQFSHALQLQMRTVQTPDQQEAMAPFLLTVLLHRGLQLT